MASEKILNEKKAVVEEIKSKLKNNKTFLLLDYQGLSDSELKSLRKDLRSQNSDVKIYKNTLMHLALKDEKIELDDYMTGPNAYLFSNDVIEPIKLISEFGKNHPSLEIRIGYIDGEKVELETIKKYATIPSMEGLLTMFAGGLIEHVRNLSIACDLYAKKLESEGGK